MFLQTTIADMTGAFQARAAISICICG